VPCCVPAPATIHRRSGRCFSSDKRGSFRSLRILPEERVIESASGSSRSTVAPPDPPCQGSYLSSVVQFWTTTAEERPERAGVVPDQRKRNVCAASGGPDPRPRHSSSSARESRSATPSVGACSTR
jgi:hypothetical protein